MDIAPTSAATALPRAANERLKTSFRSWFWGSMVLATVIHFAIFALWPELSAPGIAVTDPGLVALELPPEIEIPPEPARLTRPASPVAAETVLDDDFTIPPTTFERNPVNELPPPPENVTEDMAQSPRFTPFTVAPTILNIDEVVRAMGRAYPPLLRDAGIGGTVRVYFFIDENGVVRDVRIDQSSGHRALDDAALQVADAYRFSPALNRDTRVPVWVSFPITFQVR